MPGDGVEHLLERQRDLHGPLGDHRQRRHQRLELDVELAAIAAAEERHLDAHAVFRPAEQPRDLDAHEGRALRGGVERERGCPCNRRSRRTARTGGAAPSGCGTRARTRAPRGGEGLVDVASAQLVVERDVGASRALEVLEIGERAGRLELVVHQDFVLGGLDLVIDRRQFLVFGDDQRGRRSRRHADRRPAPPRPARRRNAPCRWRGSADRGTPARNRDAG